MATRGTRSTKSSKASASSKASKSGKGSSKKKATEAPPFRGGGVLDLQAIEDELNSDARAQAAFVKNPSKYLQDQGLKLRASDKAELKTLSRDLTTGPKAAEGSALGEVGIRIVIRRWIR